MADHRALPLDLMLQFEPHACDIAFHWYKSRLNCHKLIHQLIHGESIIVVVFLVPMPRLSLVCLGHLVCTLNKPVVTELNLLVCLYDLAL